VEEISILGRMLIHVDLDAATKIFEYNSSRLPNSWLGYLDLGYAYKLDGEIEAAKASALKAIELNPTNKDVKFLLDEMAETK
jgi:tetratricopeptide (TPR) repeat protein